MNGQSHYLDQLIGQSDEDFQALERYAELNQVPIMERDSISVMLHYMRVLQPKNVLEIGTAIGYSGSRILKAVEAASLVTVERDEERARKAEDTFLTFGLDDRVVLYKEDALHIEDSVRRHAPFDSLFIDAAKGQYETFFNLYAPFVREGGIVFTDNVLFKGLVADKEDHPNRNTRALVRKIRAFNKKMMETPDWQTIILPVGDGLMISIKQNGGNAYDETGTARNAR
ncbi:O-methyltransferase [Salisediminibacterium selenitireducens]|uniref:tRNA 5-hydroxyuridine methyltransferase n=1 Tax=Bacillus selenitireducens (strain ATCC 700615 / DSM 15326 / MLS10) TaxID=439292 RepID=D6XWW3_BACIE|nr:O-methyltransferase [Salisediminibacterium selenitireducens]ADH99939.1 O-methyltransferase family 3 [[Bacillus] selenitireducens MLS10]